MQVGLGLVLRDITKKYSKFFLQPISARVAPGHIVALVGRNGAGKSTLIKSAYGLVTPDSGQVILNGKIVVDSQRGDQLAARLAIGYLPEEQVFYEWMTVDRLLTFCGRLHPAWQPVRAAELVTTLELDREKRVGELSKGMRVKLGLVIALAHSPQALLLDEPLSGLDPLSRKATLEEIRSLVVGSNCSCVVSSHDFEDIKKISDAVWVLKDGAISFQADLTPSGHWQSRGATLDSLYDAVIARM